jgi:hypothetical protein
VTWSLCASSASARNVSVSDMTCKECGTDTCHRTNINPYCSATVRTRCEFCRKIRTVSGFHFCDEEGE